MGSMKADKQIEKFVKDRCTKIVSKKGREKNGKEENKEGKERWQKEGNKSPRSWRMTKEGKAG